IKILVVEHHGYVEIRETRQAKACGFVAGIKLIKEQVETGESLVDVLSCEVDAVVVIPECAHRLVDVSQRRVTRSEARQHVWIMLVIPFSLGKEIAREAVRFRGSMAIVKVG